MGNKTAGSTVRFAYPGSASGTRPRDGQATVTSPRELPRSANQRTDSDSMATAAARVALASGRAPDCRITFVVKDGWITLSGMVDWPAQKSSAIESLTTLPGICGVKDNVVLSSVFVQRAKQRDH